VSVVSHENTAGDVSIGVEVEGAFVPFLTYSRAKIVQHVERWHNLQERADAGDELAKDVLGDAYKKSTSKSKPKSEPGTEG